MTHQIPSGPTTDRRTLLATAATAVSGTALAGCLELFGGDDDDPPTIGQIGSGRPGRGAPEGTPMSEMPPLEGYLEVYSGRGEFLVSPLIAAIDNHYEEFTVDVRYGGSTGLANQIVTEGDGTRADVFYSVNAGALGYLVDEGRTRPLSGDVLDMVRPEFRTDDWIGTSGRARTVPYNTDALSADELPNDVHAYAEGFDGALGWAPSYGSCQAFVTAMRLLDGEERTREWLRGVVDADIADYPHELAVCQAVADGEIDAGFTNHYYIQRVLDGDPDAPLATAFTDGDAGSIFNVAGAAVVDTTADAALAENFVRHLLSAEAQDYFARSTFEYPLIPDVDPVGDLPPIDELAPPSELDLTQLSDLEPTIDLMRDVGIDV